MDRIVLTRACQLIQVTDLLDDIGVNTERMLERARLPMWHYSDPEDSIPLHHLGRLLDLAARELGDPYFGLHVAQEMPFRDLGALGKLLATKRTPYASFKTMCRVLSTQNTTARYWVEERGEEVWFCHNRVKGLDVGQWQFEQYVLMRTIDHLDVTPHPHWKPAKVSLGYSKEPGDAFREALGDPEIRLGQEYIGIAVPREMLIQPLRWYQARNGRSPVEIENMLLHSPPASGLVEALELVTGTLLKNGKQPRIETIAEIVGLSVRSLQRRLAEHGLSHSQIVEQARFHSAARLLRESDIRITDIAMELNYSDSPHFSRAFKRWAGVSPREYRRARVVL